MIVTWDVSLGDYPLANIRRISLMTCWQLWKPPAQFKQVFRPYCNVTGDAGLAYKESLMFTSNSAT